MRLDNSDLGLQDMYGILAIAPRLEELHYQCQQTSNPDARYDPRIFAQYIIASTVLSIWSLRIQDTTLSYDNFDIDP